MLTLQVILIMLITCYASVLVEMATFHKLNSKSDLETTKVIQISSLLNKWDNVALCSKSKQYPLDEIPSRGLVKSSRNLHSHSSSMKTVEPIPRKEPVSGVIRASQFTDKYREKNINALRHLFKADKNVRNILWEIGLRSEK